MTDYPGQAPPIRNQIPFQLLESISNKRRTGVELNLRRLAPLGNMSRWAESLRFKDLIWSGASISGGILRYTPGR